MASPHPCLIEVAAGRPVPEVSGSLALMRSVYDHRMEGLLWTRVVAGETVLHGLDPARLATSDLLVRSRTKQLWRTLAEVVRRLEPLDVSVATTKGVTAERRWYDRVGERPCSDVDLLLPPVDIHRIDEVVEALDPQYRRRRGLRQRIVDGLQQGVTLSLEGVAVDLHAELPKLGVTSRTREDVWSRVRPYPLPVGGTVLVLDPEGQLLHFLLHLNKDRFPCLLGYVDVARVVGREQLEWERLTKLARDDGVDDVVALSLDAVFGTLGLPSPSHLVERRGVVAFPMAPAWRLLYRPAVRLQGLGAIADRPRRLLFVPLVVIKGRRREALCWLLRRLWPPPSVLRDLYDGDGPFALRSRVHRLFSHRRG